MEHRKLRENPLIHTFTTSFILLTLNFGSNAISSETIQELRDQKEKRFEKYQATIKHGKSEATQSEGTRMSNAKETSLKDLRALFCPQLFKKSNSNNYVFGEGNTGSSDLLDYLKNLNPGSNYTANAKNFIQSMQKPIQNEVSRYEKLYQQINDNGNTYNSYTSRKRRHVYATYKKEKNSKEEAQEIKDLVPLMSAQAISNLEEIKNLGFEVDSTLRNRDPHPVINNLLLVRNSGFFKRMRERKDFLVAASKNPSLTFERLNETQEIAIKGTSLSLKELFLVGGEEGYKIYEDASGNYFVAKNNEEQSKHESLCDPSLKEDSQEDLNAKQILERILDTGTIKLSEKECETLRKEMDGESGDVGQYLAGNISSSIEYRGSEATEILIPRDSLSEDLKKSIDAVTPDLKKEEQRITESSAKLDTVIGEIENFLAQPIPPKPETSEATTFIQNSDSQKRRQFISDTLSFFEGEAIGASLEELEKKYPRLMAENPDLATRFLEAHNTKRVQLRNLESSKLKAQALSNKDYVPLAITTDLEDAAIDKQFATLYEDKEKPSSTLPNITSGITYENHINPETGNLEVYVCEEPVGEPELPLKRLMNKPIFTLDKSNLVDENLNRPQGIRLKNYNSNLWSILVDRIHCPGDPEESIWGTN